MADQGALAPAGHALTRLPGSAQFPCLVLAPQTPALSLGLGVLEFEAAVGAAAST